MFRLRFPWLLLIIPVLFLLIPGCVKQKVDIKKGTFRTLPALQPYQATYSHEIDDVLVCVKKLTSQDSSRYLGCNVIRKGYQPVIISIRNKGHDFLLWQPSHMGLPLVSPSKVSKQCQWPILLISGFSAYVAAIFFWQALIPIGCATYYMYYQNKQISKHLKTDVIDSWEPIEIFPMSTTTRILFVEAEDSPRSFVITLFSREHKKPLEFWIKLEDRASNLYDQSDPETSE